MPDRFISCDHVGVAGTTRVVVRSSPKGGFEARVGVSLLGTTNRPEEELKHASPFDDDFEDNYAAGKGTTEAEAIAAMKADMISLSRSLW